MIMYQKYFKDFNYVNNLFNNFNDKRTRYIYN